MANTTKPKFKIGDVLKVVNPTNCVTYRKLEVRGACSIKITVAHQTFYRYQILNKGGNLLGWCECFKDEDLKK